MIGGQLTALFKPDALRKAFGWVLLLMAAVVLGKETEPVVGTAMAAGTLIAALAYLTYCRTPHRPRTPRVPSRSAHAGPRRRLFATVPWLRSW